jgi:Spirocyclase AveC-like
MTTETLATPSRESTLAPDSGRTPAALWWATLGAAFLTFELYVLVKWVAGPYFKRVPSGPNQPPTWMKIELVACMAISVPLAIFLLYWFLVRPWRREGQIKSDGLLAAAFFLMAWQDPTCSYFSNWFTYNAWMPNMGSWAMSIPGWTSPQRPGAMIAEPLLITFWVYCWLWFGLSLLGCEVMRRVKARWPGTGDIRLVGACLLFMIFADFVAEGLLILPGGWFEYPGGHGGLFPGTYHKWPWHEGLFAGAWFTAVACLRYFKNDRGETVVERGVDRLRYSRRRRDLVRFLGFVGITNVIALACYNVPTAIVTARSSSWPADFQRRSYLTDRICGSGTTFACPGPGVPLPRTAKSAHLDPNGRLVVPAATKLPKLVPFSSVH